MNLTESRPTRRINEETGAVEHRDKHYDPHDPDILAAQQGNRDPRKRGALSGAAAQGDANLAPEDFPSGDEADRGGRAGREAEVPRP